MRDSQFQRHRWLSLLPQSLTQTMLIDLLPLCVMHISQSTPQIGRYDSPNFARARLGRKFDGYVVLRGCYDGQTN
jgi:hypothetical protein